MNFQVNKAILLAVVAISVILTGLGLMYGNSDSEEVKLPSSSASDEISVQGGNVIKQGESDGQIVSEKPSQRSGEVETVVESPALAHEVSEQVMIHNEADSSSNSPITREMSKPYLESIIGDIENQIDSSKKRLLQNDPAYMDWMLQLQTVLGSDLTEQQKQVLIENQIKTVEIRNRIQEAYLSGNISWDTYVKSLNALAVWSDGPYQDVLTDENYEKLFNFKKQEIPQVAESTFSPPDDREVFNVFPNLKDVNPQMTEAELYTLVPKSKIEHLVSLQKNNSGAELSLQQQLDSGNISEQQFFHILSYHEEQLQQEAKRLLTESEYEILFKPASVD